MKDVLIGKMTALLEITQKQAEENRQMTMQLRQMTDILTVAAREIDCLRGLVGDIEVLAREAKRPTWLSSGELAADLNISSQTIRNWYKRGIIPGHREDKKSWIMFDRDEVRQALRAIKEF